MVALRLGVGRGERAAVIVEADGDAGGGGEVGDAECVGDDRRAIGGIGPRVVAFAGPHLDHRRPEGHGTGQDRRAGESVGFALADPVVAAIGRDGETVDAGDARDFTCARGVAVWRMRVAAPFDGTQAGAGAERGDGRGSRWRKVIETRPGISL